MNARWFAFGVLTLSTVASASTWQAFKAVVSKDFFRNMVNQPLTQSQSVSDYVSGTVISGTALTTANLAVDFMPSESWAGIAVRVDSTTNASTLGVNVPRSDIQVNISATSFTTMTSWKPIFILPDRIATNAAQSSAQTTLSYSGIGVDASGMFWRLKTRVAERQAWEQAWATKAQNEARTSQKVAGEMNKMLDDKATPMITDLNRYYQRVLYKPFFTDGKIPGSLHFSTTNESLAAMVAVDDMTAEPPPPTLGGNPIYLWLHEELLNRTIAREVAGKKFNEEDLEEFLVKNGIPAGLGKYRAGDAQMMMQLCQTAPLKVHFGEGKVALTMCLENAALGDAVLARSLVNMEYQPSIDSDGALRLERNGAVRFANGTPEMTKRLSRIFPATVAAGHFHLPGGGKIAPEGDLRVNRQVVKNGWALVEWTFVKAGE